MAIVPGFSFRLERDFKDHAEFFGEFHRARLHDFGAEAGEFEHFVVGNLVELLRIGDQARVGGINAINVGINLAQVGFQRGGEGNGREIGAAAAERGDLTFESLALEPGDDDHIALLQQFVDFFRGDIVNLRLWYGRRQSRCRPGRR